MQPIHKHVTGSVKEELVFSLYFLLKIEGDRKYCNNFLFKLLIKTNPNLLNNCVRDRQLKC